MENNASDFKLCSILKHNPSGKNMVHERLFFKVKTAMVKDFRKIQYKRYSVRQ